MARVAIARSEDDHRLVDGQQRGGTTRGLLHRAMVTRSRQPILLQQSATETRGIGTSLGHSQFLMLNELSNQLFVFVCLSLLLRLNFVSVVKLNVLFKFNLSPSLSFFLADILDGIVFLSSTVLPSDSFQAGAFHHQTRQSFESHSTQLATETNTRENNRQ